MPLYLRLLLGVVAAVLPLMCIAGLADAIERRVVMMVGTALTVRRTAR